MVGTGHKFRIEIDVLGENHYSVAVGTRIVGGFSYASTYTTKDPVDAINKAIDGAVEKADNCKTFLLTKKSLDRDANED